MIHHTLLPEDEIKSLRMEYRIRLIIISLFFISLAIFIGILSLFPAYMAAYSPETWEFAKTEEVQINKQVVSTADMRKELAVSQQMIQKISASENGNIDYSGLIQNILSYRSEQIFINSMEISRSAGTSTSAEVLIIGKADSRESLIDFKKSLEVEKTFRNIDLPVSDLAKSKDIKFSLRVTAASPAQIMPK